MKNKYRIHGLFLVFITGFILSQPIPIQAKESAVYSNEDMNFSIEYPKSWVNGQKYSPSTVLQVNDPSGSPDLGISVSVLKENMNLDNSPEEWINAVKNIPETEGFRIVYKKSIKLNDGTIVVKARISWTLQKLNLMTSFIALDKNDKRIVVSSTGLANISFKVMEGIIDSFKFNK